MVRTMLSLVVSRSWSVHQLDVKNVFLHVTLLEIIYYSQPTGFVDPAQPDRICLLNKSLYGLKQAPRAWHNWFAMYITSLGFVEAKSGTFLFIFRCGTDTVYLLLYVDGPHRIQCSTSAANHICPQAGIRHEGSRAPSSFPGSLCTTSG
jgi:hypothetical protein